MSFFWMVLLSLPIVATATAAVAVAITYNKLTINFKLFGFVITIVLILFY